MVFCGNAEPKIVNRLAPIAADSLNSTLSRPASSLNVSSRPLLNVVTLFIDSVSRAQFHRRLPRTKKVLEAIATAQDSKADLYEFERYHAVGFNTLPNTRALWAGLDEKDGNVTGPPIWEQYRKAGYVTARADPMCQDWEMYYEGARRQGEVVRAASEAALDHEYIAPLCFPPTLPVGKHMSGNFAGSTSIKARCVSDTHVGWHLLDWGSDFIRHYDGKRPFYLNEAFMEGHEGSMEVLRTLDSRLAALLDPATSPIDFETTVVVLISDHGPLMGLNQAFLRSGAFEVANPMSIMVLPSSLPEAGKERLRSATRKLVSAHDMYETMRGFGRVAASSPLGDAGRRGVDLLQEDLNHRSCDDAGISLIACRCH